MAPGQGRTGSSVSFSCGVKTCRDSRHMMVPRLCFGAGILKGRGVVPLEPRRKRVRWVGCNVFAAYKPM